MSADAQRSFADAAKRFERVVSDGIEQLRAQSRAYLASHTVRQWPVQCRGEQLAPVRQPRTAARDADRVDRATLFQQHIQPIGERESYALEDGDGQLDSVRI